MVIIAIVPARYNSIRFPGKPLVKIGDKPMIQHVYEQVIQVDSLKDVIVATDDLRIKEVVSSFQGKVVMTSPHHPSGTDRIAEVARNLSCDVIVNVQCDEPFIHPAMISELLTPFQQKEAPPMSTLKKRIIALEEIKDPNTVKVVTELNGMALYFSRSPLPYPQKKDHLYYKHLGIYAYQRDFLMHLSQLKQTPLEKAESLEQLRVLENGYQIQVVESAHNSISIDTPKDLERILKEDRE